MGDEMLTSVCELAFDVAKEGGAPSAMKNYLYLAQRPPRAYSVAQRALEEDETFRTRVAARATIENVGEAGYLWLHRPEGWAQRFSELEAGSAPVSSPAARSIPLAERPPMPMPPTDAAPATADPGPAPVPAPRAPAPTPSSSSTVSSIEDELSNLRSLVDRLADERQNVRSSVSELEVELETRRSENLEMSTKLAALRQELTTVQATESTILLERDRALARIVELEDDVARLSREVERLASEAEGSSAEHEAALTDLAVVSSERDELRNELATVTSDREQARAELETVSAERTELGEAAAERDRIQGELDAVVTDRNSLSGQFNEMRAERDRLVEQLADVTDERDGLAERLQDMDQLRSDNTELASRLSVAEQARVDLETQLEEVSEKWQGAARQLAVFEGVNQQLDDAVADRNAMEAQLHQANDALAELHRRIGTSHEQIRTELSTIESAFGTAPEDDGDEEDQAAAGGLTAAPMTDQPAEEDDTLSSLGAWSDPSDATPGDEATDAITEATGAAVLDDEPTDDEHAMPTTDAFAEMDVPAFEESIDFDDEGTDAAVVDPLESLGAVTDDDFGAEDFDGAGIELDPTMLGGRTIGDMFGSDDLPEFESDLDAFAPDGELSEDMFEAVPSGHDGPSNPQALVEDGAAGAEDLPEATGTGRRQIALPAGLDDAAVAKLVVETPDVILLIDGDGVAGLGWPHLDVATRRSALVGYLASLTAHTGAAADVVFERPTGDDDALPVVRAVRVRIVDEPLSDSSAFTSYVSRYPEEWPVVIVTDQPSLRSQADELAVSVLSNDQLLDLFLDLNTEG